MNTTHDMLTVREAAQELRMHENTIYRLVREGRIPHQKYGRTIRIPRQATTWDALDPAVIPNPHNPHARLRHYAPRLG